MMHLPASAIVNDFRPIIERQFRSLNPDEIPMDPFGSAESEDDKLAANRRRQAQLNQTSPKQDSFAFQNGAEAAMAGIANAVSMQGKSELPHVLLDATEEERRKHKDEQPQATVKPLNVLA